MAAKKQPLVPEGALHSSTMFIPDKPYVTGTAEQIHNQAVLDILKVTLQSVEELKLICRELLELGRRRW